MSWDNQQNPWGGNKRPPTPEELIARLLEKIKHAFDGSGRPPRPPEDDKGGPRAGRQEGLRIIGLLVLAGLALLLGYSSFYTIQPGERGVVLRFGKYAKTTMPGLNFKLPLIDQVEKVNVDSVRKEEFGFRTKVPGQQTIYEKQGYNAESLMLTGDKNVINVEWIVQYKVRDPVKFLFQVANVRQAVRDISETVIRRTVGNMNFDYVLSNRAELASTSAQELQDDLDVYGSGVKILTVQLQDVNPPNPVKPAFNEVNEADQDMKRLVNEAEEAYNQVIPKARGQAKEKIEDAHGYAVARVNESKGDAARFLAVLKEYKLAENVTRRRLYLEAMREVLPSVTEIYVLDKDQRSVLPFLDMRGPKEASRRPANNLSAKR
jgi:membrane protease subunit HflK